MLYVEGAPCVSYRQTHKLNKWIMVVMSIEAFGYVLDLSTLPSAATLLSVLSVAIGALASLASSRLFLRGGVRSRVEAVSPERTARLPEIRDSLRRQEWVARLMGFSNGLLTFGQVIIGGVLASSFIQDTLGKQTIGLLGVLVLVSSLIHQLVRPDLKYRNARRRVAQLRDLLFGAEDAVSELKEQVSGAMPIHLVRRSVATELNRIENGEVEELPGERPLWRPKLESVSTTSETIS